MADSPLARAPGGPDAPRGAARSGVSVPDAPTNALSSERYLAWLYSPQEQQPVVTSLCQIEAEVAASLRPGIEHHVAHARLQWWREECERAAEGRAAHPLTRELVRALGSKSASNAIAGISGFVDTAVWDLAGATFETRKELTAYCDRWAAAMFEAAALGMGAEASHAARSAHVARQFASELADEMRATGAHSAPVASSATGASSAIDASSTPGTSRVRTLGSAVREVELLAGLAREAHAGRLRVPLDELERAGVDVSRLAQAPWPAALVNLLRERHESLRETIARTVSQFGRDEQASIRGLLVWAELAWRLSWRAQRALPDVVMPRRYHALADGWHAWRAAHRASAGRLRLAHRSAGLTHGSSGLN